MTPFSATPDELRAAADGLSFEVRTGTIGDPWIPVTVDELIDVVYGHDGGSGAARMLIEGLRLGMRDLMRIHRGDHCVGIRLACA
jgi:hypothetical protein